MILHLPSVDRLDDMFATTQSFEYLYLFHLARPVFAAGIGLLALLDSPYFADRVGRVQRCGRPVRQGRFYTVHDGELAIAVHMDVAESSGERSVDIILEHARTASSLTDAEVERLIPGSGRSGRGKAVAI